jgi:hypothetical protein
VNDQIVDYRKAPVYERDNNDWYVEPAWCWELMLQHERFEGSILEPCCGGGTGPRALRRAGYEGVTATDLVDRGYERFDGVVDFFAANRAVDNIAANPPYNRAGEFVERALKQARRKVAVLVQEKFAYSQERYRLFVHMPLARLYFFSSRPSMPPGQMLQDGAIEAVGGSVNYLWMVWEHGHQGAPTAHWLHRSPPNYLPFPIGGKA